MKPKLLVVSNVVTLFLLIMCLYMCNHQTKLDCHLPPPPGSCVQPIDGDLNHYTLPADDAAKLLENYTCDHWKTINSNFDTAEDSRSVWFSLSRLKGFINTIESYSASRGQGCCDTLGIRIYFGEYDDTLISSFRRHYEFVQDGNDLNGKTTVLMIPTHTLKDAINHDFNPIKTYECKSCDSLSGCWQGNILALSLLMNHGGVTPPPFACAACPDYALSGADFIIEMLDKKGKTPRYNDNGFIPPCNKPTPILSSCTDVKN